MITIQQLQYFRALAETGHLTRTAEKLCVTQSTLSNVLAKMEDQLNVRLFDRVGRTLRLSDAGAAYLPYAIRALEALEEGYSHLQSRTDRSKHLVSFAANQPTVWAGLTRDFQAMNPECTVQMVGCSDPMRLRNMLLAQEVDFVLAATTDFPLGSLEAEPFREEQLHLCVPLSHPLACRESLTLKEIADQPFLNLPAHHPFQKYCDEQFRKAGLSYTAVSEYEFRLSASLFEIGMSVTLTTRSAYMAASDAFRRKTRCIPLTGIDPPRAIAIIRNPRRQLSPLAQEFRRIVLSEKTR